MKSIFKIFSSTAIATMLFALILLAACTKVDYGDDFKPSPPPPIGDYNVSNDVAKDAIIAKWSFEGVLKDSIANITSTKDTAIGYATGRSGFGQAYQGKDGAYAVYGSPGSAILGLKSYTISMWLKAGPTNNQARGIFAINRTDDFWGNLDIYQENYGADNTTLFFKVHMNNDNAAAWKGQFTDTKIANGIGKWVHIAVTYDGATSALRIYANNQLQVINSAGNQPSTTPTLHGDDPAINPNAAYGPLKFKNATKMVVGTWHFQTYPSLTDGAGAQSWANSFLGAIDEFRIFNRALTAKEVTALFKLEKLGL
ncbi:LamG domain-containing protein [Pinibacter soli]|uniref:LamG domain-containing protein n=1 Tax=Pinibacter soli TaxID=3044211 RepID=A0ABT6R8D3_9BACT|nr:LamG domain-containing protein [Pinibacter soli]MDI3318748.1 LamG domain-containing protein [Pinibacter soli]